MIDIIQVSDLESEVDVLKGKLKQLESLRTEHTRAIAQLEAERDCQRLENDKSRLEVDRLRGQVNVLDGIHKRYQILLKENSRLQTQSDELRNRISRLESE